MKKTLLSVFMSLVVCALPAYALFEDGQNAILISNLQGSAGDSKVVLTWEATTDLSGEEAQSFVVYSSDTSVAEGLIDDYQTAYPADNSTLSIEGLVNGQTYYFAAQAIGKDGSSGPLSEEISVVPTSAEALATDTAVIDTLQVKTAEATHSTEIVVEFSEEIFLPEESPELSFSITKADDQSSFLLVWSAEYEKENEGTENEVDVLSRIVLSTDEQEEGQEYIVTVSALITNLEGNPIESGITDSASFIGTATTEAMLAEENTIPEELPVVEEVIVEEPITEEVVAEEPIVEEVIVEEPVVLEEELGAEHDAASELPAEAPDSINTVPSDASNFVANFKTQANDFLIRLTWVLSADAASEAVDQIMYHSLNKGESWDNGITLSKGATSYELSGAPETEHTFKLTTKGADGTESTGVITSIRLPALAATGPFALIALGSGFLLAGTRGLKRRKKGE